jgi:hypothetical protein
MLALISQVLGVSVASTSRPALVFFVVQVVVGVAHRLEAVQLPDTLSWSVSLLAMGFGLSAAVLELITQHTDEIEELLREFHLDKVFGGLGASASGGLLFAAHTVSDEARREDVMEAVRIVSEADLAVWQQSAIVAVAVTLNIGLVWVRGRLLSWLDDLDLKSWWAWLETGGVGVTLFMIAVLPTVTLVLLGLVVGVLVVTVLVGQFFSWTWDKAHRSPCPSCEVSVRDEALGCPACGVALEPSKLLSKRPAARPQTRPEAEPA